MFRIYAQYDAVAVRTARRYNDLQKAAAIAATIHAKCVEIRELLPSGKERLVDVYQNGKSCAT